MYQHHLKRHLENPSTAWTIEELESRTLLSGGVFDISKVPIYTPTSGSISDVKHGPLGNAGQHLAGLYSEFKRFLKKGGNRNDFVSKSEPLLQYKGTSVAVTLRTRDTIANTTNTLHQLGAEIIYRSGKFQAIDAWVPVSQLSTLAANPKIANVNPAFQITTFSAGIAGNQGDIGQNANSLRTTFGVDGTGVKVGVLSDSVNSVGNGLAASVATGDLPTGVQVIADGVGTDEGRAMLEEIHDIAPGASLAFATAGTTSFEFAHNIVQLVNAGCNVIVDDVGLVDEPFFQEGLIGQAVIDAVENHGVTYLSAARNGGVSGFQVDTHFVQSADGRTLLDWDPSDGVDTRMRMAVAGIAPVTLGWDEAFNGVVGAATVDLDIAFIDPSSGAIVAQGIDSNLTTGRPVEVVGVPAGLYDVEVSVSNIEPGASLPSMIKFASSQGGRSVANITSIEYTGLRASTSGHNAGIDTISVGAVPFNLSPAFNNHAPVTSEDFSAAGPVTYLFNSNGERRSKPLTLLKPDISGIDAVNTSFFGTDSSHDSDKLPNFSGTSAAAPNVAAVVALMLQVKPGATPVEIKAALIESAKKNPVNGQVPGEYDPQAGFGLIDGLLAAHALNPDIPIADIQRLVPNSVPNGIKSLSINFTEPVIGFDLSDLMLTRGKGSTTNLLKGTESLTSTDGQHYVLSGLAPDTRRRGTYTLTFLPSGVVDSDNNPALGGSTSFVVSGAPSDVVAVPISSSEIDLLWNDNTTNEKEFIVTRADDSVFATNVKTFHVKPNVTSLKDTGLPQATQFFYQVKAVVGDGAPEPNSSVRNAFTLASNEAVTDNRSTKGVSIEGTWATIEDDGSFAGDYLSDENNDKGHKRVTFTPLVPSSGDYFVYVRALKGKSHSSNTPIDVFYKDGSKSKTFIVDQRNNSGWLLLGKFELASGRRAHVVIRNDGTNGTVVADAVRFQKADATQ